MQLASRIVTGILGVLFLVNALQWVFTPAEAAAALGMPLLEGIGRSTQVGDLGAFFFTAGGVILLGAITMERHWTYTGAFILGCAATVRTIAWAFHGADFATPFIVTEVVCAGVLLFAATRLRPAS